MTTSINKSTSKHSKKASAAIKSIRSTAGKDHHYVTALKNHDNRVLSRLYTELFPTVQRYILKLGGTQEESKDIFQQALTIMYLKVQEDSFVLTSSFATYLIGICKFKWLDIYKSKYRKCSSLDTFDCANDDQDVVDKMFHQSQGNLFQEKFESLTDDNRKVLELFFSGHSMKEIAKLMGYGSEGYARKKKHVCQQQLIGLIQKDIRYSELKIA